MHLIPSLLGTCHRVDAVLDCPCRHDSFECPSCKRDTSLARHKRDGIYPRGQMGMAGYTGVLRWAAHTTKEGDYMIPKDASVAELPAIEVVIVGFRSEVRGVGGMTIRPHVLVKDLTDEDLDRFDAVAIPACVGGGRGQHT